MKHHVAGFLLCYIVANIGTATGFVDTCHNGLYLFETFINKPCGAGNVDPIARLVLSSRWSVGPLTADKVRRFVAGYCSTALPTIRRCFAERIEHCTPQQQRYLNQVANETGFLCTPGSDQVQEWVSRVLASLNDSHVTEGSACHERAAILATCRRYATYSADLASDMDPAQLGRASVRDFVPVMQTFFSSLFGCMLRKFRQDPARCSGWRWHVLNAFVDFRHMGPTPYGFHLTLSRVQTTLFFEL